MDGSEIGRLNRKGGRLWFSCSLHRGALLEADAFPFNEEFSSVKSPIHVKKQSGITEIHPAFFGNAAVRAEPNSELQSCLG